MTSTFKEYVGDERRKGVFIEASYTPEDCKKLHDWAKNTLHLKDPLAPHLYHTTLLYSRAQVDAEKLITNKNPGWIVAPKSYELLGDDHEVLVLIIDAPEMIKLHQQLLKAGGTHDYDKFIPHITLSYNIKDDGLDVGSMQVPSMHLRVSGIKAEPLDLNWKK